MVKKQTGLKREKGKFKDTLKVELFDENGNLKEIREPDKFTISKFFTYVLAIILFVPVGIYLLFRGLYRKIKSS